MSFVDRLILQGRYQVRPNLPFTPGSVAVGRVEAIGDDLDPDLVGTRRAALMVGWGGLASHVIVPATSTASVPASLDAVTPAGTLEPYGTAWFALVDRATVRPGDRVLVLGASGAVGHACADLARHLGADVTVVTADPSACRAALGDVRVIDRTGGPVRDLVRTAVPGGVDLVIDPVGGPMAEPALRSLRSRGQYLVVGFASSQIPAVPLNQILLRNRTVLGVEWGSTLLEQPELVGRHVERVLAGVVAQHLRPQPVRAVALDALPSILAAADVIVPGRMVAVLG